MKSRRPFFAIGLVTLLITAGCAQAPEVDTVDPGDPGSVSSGSPGAPEPAGDSNPSPAGSSSAAAGDSPQSEGDSGEITGIPQPSQTEATSGESSASTDGEDPAAIDLSALDPTAFGETFTWEDGLSVTISAPKAFKPSKDSASRFPEHVQFEVALTNGTSKRFDPTMTTGALQSGDQDGERIFDYAKGIEGEPETALLPGRTTKWKVAYGVMDADDLVLDFAPDWDHDKAVFLFGTGRQDPSIVAPRPSETPDATPGEGTAYFGQSFLREDGILFTASSPKPYKRSSDSGIGGEDSEHAVTFDVSVYNGSDAVFDPSMVSLNLQSGESDGDQIFDGGAGLAGGPSASLLPGRSAHWTVAFGVSAPKDLVLEINTDWEHDPAIFVTE